MQDFPDAYTMAQIEARARKLRAEALRDMIRSAKGYVSSLFTARPQDNVRANAKAA